MKIAFFEVESWGKKYLRKHLPAHTLIPSSGSLNPEKIENIRDADIISIFIYSTIDRTVLDKLSQLKLIATRSTGFDHIDIDECRRRGIVVSNVPSYGENTVAEHTFALILSLSRHLCQACVQRMMVDFSPQGLTGFDLE